MFLFRGKSYAVSKQTFSITIHSERTTKKNRLTLFCIHIWYLKFEEKEKNYKILKKAMFLVVLGNFFFKIIVMPFQAKPGNQI